MNIKATALYVLVEADTDAIRTDTFMGEDHMVVPVIALVEGVVHASNSPVPELALAAEFARHPSGWNGRPIVLDHPSINGLKVSANSPTVLQEEAFGSLFNTELDGIKLKSEMWINLARVEELGDDVKEAVAALESGELSEISTGLFSDVEQRKGTFNGKAFDGIWRNVTPDHLAILPAGIIGACSVEGGCGAPRVNAAGEERDCDLCVAEKERTMAKTQAKHDPAEDIKKKKKKKMNKDDEEPKGSSGLVLDPEEDLKDNGEPEPDPSIIPDEVGGFRAFVSKFRGLISFRSGKEEIEIITNKELSDRDTKTSLMIALQKEGESEFPFIIALFSGSFVYEPDFSGKLLKRDFTLDSKGGATLGSKTTEVRPITEFVPASQRMEEKDVMTENTTAQRVDALIANEGTAFTDEQKEWLLTLSEDQLTAMEPVAPKSEVTPTVNTESTETAETTKKAEPQTTEQFLSAAPPEVQEVLNEGIALRNQKRATIITALKANDSCDYTEDELKAMSVVGLEKLAKLANVQTFEGQGGGLRTQMDIGDDGVPEAPNVFDLPERKSA